MMNNVGLDNLYRAKVVSTVKRTNTRLVRLAKAYGTESSIYQEAVKTLQITPEFSPYIRHNKNGVIQISQSVAGVKKGLKTRSQFRRLAFAMNKVETVKNVTKRVWDYAGGTKEELELTMASARKDDKLSEFYEGIENFASNMFKQQEDFSEYISVLYNILEDAEIWIEDDKFTRDGKEVDIGKARKEFMEEANEQLNTLRRSNPNKKREKISYNDITKFIEGAKTLSASFDRVSSLYEEEWVRRKEMQQKAIDYVERNRK